MRGPAICYQISTLLGTDTGLPLVRIVIGTEDHNLESKDARRLALNLLAASEAADMDKMIYEYLSGQDGVGDAKARAAIHFFREYRAKLGDSVPGSDPV